MITKIADNRTKVSTISIDNLPIGSLAIVIKSSSLDNKKYEQSIIIKTKSGHSVVITNLINDATIVGDSLSQQYEVLPIKAELTITP